MTGFVLGLFTFYLIGAALEWRIVRLYQIENPDIDSLDAIVLALRWPITNWLMGEDQD